MAPVYNFNAGPATLPPEVMRRAQEEFVDYQGLGYGIIEASHRAPEFAAIIEAAEANIRELVGIGDDYAVLFLQGGASTQFALVPMNLRPDDASADYVDTGSWSKKAIKEAKNLGATRVAASSADANYTYIPDAADWDCDPDAAYLHITTNNTIAGTQYAEIPATPGAVLLAADMSSDILSRPFDVNRFAVVYAGAQKNLGPAGCTLVIVRKDLAEQVNATVPTMFKYATHIDKGSCYNTPPTFSVYMIKLVTDWLKANGGLTAMAHVNTAKADILYGMIDSDDFYRCPVAAGSRSKMNVVWRLPSEDLEKKFIAEAKAAGLIGLKGHRSVGGCRASIYNAMPVAGVSALVDFMAQFRAANG